MLIVRNMVKKKSQHEIFSLHLNSCLVPPAQHQVLNLCKPLEKPFNSISRITKSSRLLTNCIFAADLHKLCWLSRSLFMWRGAQPTSQLLLGWSIIDEPLGLWTSHQLCRGLFGAPGEMERWMWELKPWRFRRVLLTVGRHLNFLLIHLYCFALGCMLSCYYATVCRAPSNSAIYTFLLCNCSIV